MRASPPLVLLLASLLGAAGCSAETYAHQMSVAVIDPGGRLGPGPAAVGLFRPAAGTRAEGPPDAMGTATAEAPYRLTLRVPATRVLFDPDLPGQIVVALAIPAYEPGGYFVISIAPDPLAEKSVVAPLTWYSGHAPAPSPVPPLPVSYTSTAGDDGWTIAMTVEIPPQR